MLRPKNFMERFNTIKDDIDLKHIIMLTNFHNGFNTIKDDIDLKLSKCL